MPETENQIKFVSGKRPLGSPYRRVTVQNGDYSNKSTGYYIDPKQKQNDIILLEKPQKSLRSTGSQTRQPSEDSIRKPDAQIEDASKKQHKLPTKSSATNTEEFGTGVHSPKMNPFFKDDYSAQYAVIYHPENMIDVNGKLYQRVPDPENAQSGPQEETGLSQSRRKSPHRKPDAGAAGRNTLMYRSEDMIDFSKVHVPTREEDQPLLVYHFQEDNTSQSARGDQERHLVVFQDERFAPQSYSEGGETSTPPPGRDVLVYTEEELRNLQNERRVPGSVHRRSVEDMIDFGYYRPDRFSSWPRYHPHFNHYHGDRVQAILNMSNAYLHSASTVDYRDVLQYGLEERKQKQKTVEKKSVKEDRNGCGWQEYDSESVATIKRHHQRHRQARRTYSADRYCRQHQPLEPCRRYSSAGDWLQHQGSETEEEDDEDEDPCRCSYNQLHHQQPRPPPSPSRLRVREEERSAHQEPVSPPPPRCISKSEVTFYPHTSSTASSTSATSGTVLLVQAPRRLVAVLVVLLVAVGVGVSVPLALRSSSRGRDTALQEHLEVVTRLLHEVPLVDGHNDLPWNIRKFLHNRLRDFPFGEDLRKVTPWSNSPWSHTDLPRLKAGLVAAQFWAAYVPCESQYLDAVQLTLEQIDVIRRLTEKYYPTLTLCTSAAEIKETHSRGQVCSLIGVEGGHSLGSSLPVLRTLYSVGVRYLTLTSNCNTPWADSLLADGPENKAEHNGLSNFGKSIVKEMNRLGMLVDLAHVAVRTMTAALEVSRAPVIFSHSSARALCNSTRNVPDYVLEHVGKKGGLVMINFYSKFLTCRNKATAEDAIEICQLLSIQIKEVQSHSSQLLAVTLTYATPLFCFYLQGTHINHVRKVAGINSVGLGAGYDGINFTPQGLDDVSSYPTLFAALIATGQWSIEDLKKLAGLNFLRVMQEVEKVRDAMKAAGVGPYEDDDTNVYPSQKNCSSTNLF